MKRIGLPGGYYLAPFKIDGKHKGYDICSKDGVLVFGDVMGIEQAQAFAAAMRDEPAAPTMGEQLEGIFAGKYAAHQLRDEPAEPVQEEADQAYSAYGKGYQAAIRDALILAAKHLKAGPNSYRGVHAKAMCEALKKLQESK